MNSQVQGDYVNRRQEAQGRILSEDDYALSFLISAQAGAVWGHCYENAYPLFFAIPTLFEPHGLFVEGWIVFEDAGRVVLMEHGWLVSGERIVDPTIVLAVEFGQPVYYFPGVFRARAELEALENEFFPHVRFSDYGDDGMQHAGYRAAYEAAQQKARELLVDGKNLVEVRATALVPQDEDVEKQAFELSMIVVLPDQQSGGKAYGQKRG
jgi:hypothetical protein